MNLDLRQLTVSEFLDRTSQSTATVSCCSSG